MNLSKPGANLMLAVEHVLEGDFLAGMRGHAAHAGDQAGFDAALRFVVGLVLADGLNQVIPFVLVGIARCRWIPRAYSSASGSGP